MRLRYLTCLVIAMSQAALAQQPSTLVTDKGTQVQLSRYSSQPAEPPEALAEPLDVIAHLSFPRATVRTVGDAIRYTLARTGYAMVDPRSLAPRAEQFLDLPLPESQREIGPYRVQAILDVLLGPTWKWQRDPVQRKLWFVVTPAMASLVPERVMEPLIHSAPAAGVSSVPDTAMVVVTPVSNSSIKSAP